MAIGALLTYVRDTIRTELGWGPYQVDIQPGGHPPPMAADTWIYVDDGGTMPWSGEETYLGEKYAVAVGIMVRMGVKPADMTGDLMERDPNLYPTLDRLERQIKTMFHGRQDRRLEFNDAAGFGGDEAIAIFPLVFRSQARTYVYTSPYEQRDMRGWLRRDMMFQGMDREFLPGSVT